MRLAGRATATAGVTCVDTVRVKVRASLGAHVHAAGVVSCITK